jgi:SHAQKYF class myb-like DNA-binding protein
LSFLRQGATKQEVVEVKKLNQESFGSLYHLSETSKQFTHWQPRQFDCIHNAIMEPDNYDYDSTPPSHPAQPMKHTQFLDLTNGEGGDGTAATMMYEDDYGIDGSDFIGDGIGVSSDITDAEGGGSPPYAGVSGAKFDPSTPGRVVETGQEHTGRWTKEEHEAFLQALKMYGKEWKKVAAKVKTRTVVQTRTHAQKYFQKLSKATEGKEEPVDVEMRVVSEVRKPSSQKKKQRLTPQMEKVSRTASVASAAQVITSLHHSQQPLLAGNSSPSMPHGFHTVSIAAPDLLDLPPPDQSQGTFAASHGFSSAFAEPEPLFSTSFAAPKSSIGTSSFPMKIVAPEHDSAMKRGKFPEPSPAACGKRKLAEIAAARMLAGVAASETLLSPPPSGMKSTGPAAGWAENIEDGTATPPPEEVAGISERLHLPPPLPKSNIAVPPGASTLAQPKKPLGLSLQIVNPETLGISHEQIERRRKDGQASPVTPWEGQLQALVR